MAEAPLRQQQGHRSRVVAPPPSLWGMGDTVPLLQPGKDPVVPASAACAGTGSRYVSRVAVLAWVGFGPAVPAGGATRWEQPRCPAFWERPRMGHRELWTLGGISSPGVRGFPGETEPPGLWGAMGRAGGLCQHVLGLGHTCTPGSGWRLPRGRRGARLRVPTAGTRSAPPPTLASCPRCRRTSGEGTQRRARTGRSPAGGCAAAATSRPWAMRTAPTRTPAPKCRPGRPCGETATAAPPAPTRPGPSKGLCSVSAPRAAAGPWAGAPRERAPGQTRLRWASGWDPLLQPGGEARSKEMTGM